MVSLPAESNVGVGGDLRIRRSGYPCRCRDYADLGGVVGMKELPVVGMDYPGSLPALRSWFRSDADCLDYLDWLRWPEGFLCPWCSGVGEWPDAPWMHRCSECSGQVSVTAGTVFHRSRHR